jgi:hypothetical protein
MFGNLISRLRLTTRPIARQGAEPFTTMPVITGPVIVFKSVKNFCSSFSLALATQRPIEKGRDLVIDLGAQPADLAFRDASHAHCFDQIIDRTRRHALNI